jgi:hypothetical protein
MGELPKWMAQHGRWIKADLLQIDATRDCAASKLAKVRAACTEQGFREFCDRCGVGRSRAYELLAVAEGRTTVEEVRAKGRERAKRFYDKRRPLGTDSPKAEIIELAPPTTVVAEPEQLDHLGRSWHEQRWIENHLMRSVHEIYVGGFTDHDPEELAAMIEQSDLHLVETVAAFLTKLAEAMRRKAAA